MARLIDSSGGELTTITSCGIDEELKANRPISLPLTVETALEFLINTGHVVTLSKK